MTLIVSFGTTDSKGRYRKCQTPPGQIQAAQCEAYYEALLVNPILEVTPITALTEMVSQFVLRPLNVLGQHLGNFYANLLEPLPWVWKLPVLLVATTIIVIVILIAFRYKLNFGFNLFCLEPTSYKSLSQSEESKQVKRGFTNYLPRGLNFLKKKKMKKREKFQKISKK